MINLKKNGFTLVELLAVIVILALLLTIAVPSVIQISNRIKKNMYCSKIEDLESAAKLYGNDNIDYFDTHDQVEVSVKDLVENNLFKKEDNKCEYNDSKPCVKNPRDGSSMDNDKIVITKRDKKIVAEYDKEKKKVCND